jgi:hypothetical protein
VSSQCCNQNMFRFKRPGHVQENAGPTAQVVHSLTMHGTDIPHISSHKDYIHIHWCRLQVLLGAISHLDASDTLWLVSRASIEKAISGRKPGCQRYFTGCGHEALEVCRTIGCLCSHFSHLWLSVTHSLRGFTTGEVVCNGRGRCTVRTKICLHTPLVLLVSGLGSDV